MSKLWDIVKTVGTGIIKDVVPGGGLIVSAVNSLLPEDKKLPESATGHQINDAISSLPPEKQAEILNKQFDVDIAQIKAQGDTLKAMLTADATTPHTTRPKIAYQAFQVLGFVIIVTISLWAYSVGAGALSMTQAVVNGWPFVLSVVAPLIYLLKAYFGILSTEHKNKLDSANGLPTAASGIIGAISNLIKK